MCSNKLLKLCRYYRFINGGPRTLIKLQWSVLIWELREVTSLNYMIGITAWIHRLHCHFISLVTYNHSSNKRSFSEDRLEIISLMQMFSYFFEKNRFANEARVEKLNGKNFHILSFYIQFIVITCAEKISAKKGCSP